MRNPLKRHAARDVSKPTLRTRLAGAKGKLAAARDKAGRLVAVNRILLGMPLPTAQPAPPPPVDRVALVNYATFLALERYRVCAELYPHMGEKASRFVIGLNAADAFFHHQDAGRPRNLPPASTRALKVLDLVGIDWRQDTDEADRARYDDAGRADTGERPAVPHDWPALDAGLTEALDDMERLDAACAAMYDAGNQDRDGDTVPGYGALEEARSEAIQRLSALRARGLPGLQAKARAMLNPTLRGAQGPFEDIADSLARDLIGALPSVLDQHQPDPLLLKVEEAKRLYAILSATFDEWPHSDRSEPQDLQDRRADATEALWDFVRGTLLKTVPTTPAGCSALARFMPELLNGSDWSDDAPVILSLIARSPMRA